MICYGCNKRIGTRWVDECPFCKKDLRTQPLPLIIQHSLAETYALFLPLENVVVNEPLPE